MSRSSHTLLFSLPSPPAHISFSPGQGRTRTQSWKKSGCWLLRDSQGSSKIVLSIAEIWYIMHSILTPRSKTYQRLHEYQALHKLDQAPAILSSAKLRKIMANCNRKTHCNKAPSICNQFQLPAAPAHPCASCFPYPITHSIFLQGTISVLVDPLQWWPCRGGGLVRRWVVPLAPWCYGSPPHTTRDSLLRREVSMTIKMEHGPHALVSLFRDGQAICRWVPSREYVPISFPAPVSQLQTGSAHPYCKPVVQHRLCLNPRDSFGNPIILSKSAMLITRSRCQPRGQWVQWSDTHAFAQQWLNIPLQLVCWGSQSSGVTVDCRNEMEK